MKLPLAVRRQRASRFVEPSALASYVYEAAGDIEKYGWRRGGVRGDTLESNPLGDYDRCMWIAGMRAMERHIGSCADLSDHVVAFESALCVHFEVPTISDVFTINDRLIGSDDEGKAWAVRQLREVATKLHGADAWKLVAGPVTA